MPELSIRTPGKDCHILAINQKKFINRPGLPGHKLVGTTMDRIVYTKKIKDFLKNREYVVFKEIERGKLIRIYAVSKKQSVTEFNKTQTDEKIPDYVLNTTCYSIPQSRFKEQIYHGRDNVVSLLYFPSTDFFEIRWEE